MIFVLAASIIEGVLLLVSQWDTDDFGQYDGLLTQAPCIREPIVSLQAALKERTLPFGAAFVVLLICRIQCDGSFDGASK